MTGLSSQTYRIPLLDEIISSPDLRPLFQPIIDLHAGDGPAIFGFEALARFRSANPILDPEFLFLYAGRKNRTCDLDVACLERSLRHGSDLLPARLFVNIHPTMLMEAARWIHLIELYPSLSGRLVLEVTEQGALDQQVLTTNVFSRLRDLGVELALDDVGIAYSHLALIDRIRPKYIKISHLFGTGFEQDPTKEKIIRNVMGLAADFGCRVVLEGIETRATADAATSLGIALGQGYFYSRPQEAVTFR